MPLKKHHKIMLGGFSGFLIILLIANSVLIYVLYGKLQYDYIVLDEEITKLKEDTQSKLNELTTSVIETRGELDTQLGTINEEFDLLKASVSSDFSGVAQEAVKAVVTVKTDVGQGTGFLLTTDGYIVTNAHVLAGGRIVQVVTYEQGTKQAVFIGYDATLDIALLKIDGNYERLRLADSDDIQVGEKVIAIGNPLGLQFSVSEGIVSAIHRTGTNDLDAYIQTDAALNPGNSGGPLINKQGKVIGINNFKIGSGENLGFALESNYIEEAVNQIAEQALNASLI